MPSTDNLSGEEAFEQGFHGIPDPQKRAKMSPEKLAIELSKQEKDSPPYILLEHELNLRLAKEQSEATREAGRYGGHAAVLAALLTAIIGYLLGSSQTNEFQKANACPSATCACSYPVTPLAPSIQEKPTQKNTNGKVNPKPQPGVQPGLSADEVGSAPVRSMLEVSISNSKGSNTL